MKRVLAFALIVAGMVGLACTSDSSPDASGGGNAGAASGGNAGSTSAGATAGNTGSGGNAGQTGRGGTGGPAGESGGGGQRGGSGGSAGTGGTGGSAGGGAGGSAHAGAWRIMPLGDSITGTTCVPQLLSKKLKDAGHDNFTFVGTVLNNQACDGAPFVQSEGHGGYLVTDLMGTKASELTSWCSKDQAEVVLMHFGTNDAWSSKSTQSILDAYVGVLAALRAVNPKVIVFVAQIIPLNPSNCSGCETRVQDLNSKIPDWATRQTTADSPVYVVDAHSAFTASEYVPNSTYTGDGCHPNPAGSQLIADKWYESLLAKGIL